MAYTNGTVVYFTSNGPTYLFYDEESYKELFHHGQNHDRPEMVTVQYNVVHCRFNNAKKLRPKGFNQQSYYHNYFIGKDPDKWASEVPLFESIVYENLYPGISIEYVLTKSGLKYNVILEPDADVTQLRMTYNGLDKISKALDGELQFHLSFGKITESIPFSYRETNGGDKPIHFQYKLDGFTVGFEPKGRRFIKSKRVIDPTLEFSTYSGSSVDNFGFTATYDESGNLYSGGIADYPSDFIPKGYYPVTPGAFSTTYAGGVDEAPVNIASDVAINKYSADGSQLLYATFIGGAGNEYPHSMIVDLSGNLYIFGTTRSPNFPTAPNAFQKLRKGGADLFVFKLSPDGSTMLGSTYIGGSADDGLNSTSALRYFYADDFRGEINLNRTGDVFIGSCTRSADFPVTPNATQTEHGGAQDGVIVKLNGNLDKLAFSSYYGGSSNDAVYSVEVNSADEVYISGGTMSSNLPGHNSVNEGSFLGLVDGFIAQLAPNGKSVTSLRYYGTSLYEQILGLELDLDENVYVVGHTTGEITATSEAYDAVNGKQFVSKFSSNLKNRLFSANYGSSRNAIDITMNAFMVDDCNRLYISGWGGGTGRSGSSTSDLVTTSDALQRTTDGADFYLIVFMKDARDVLYATYFGGDQSNDHVDGGTSRFDRDAIIYQSVCSSCPPSPRTTGNELNDFPTSSGAFSERNKSPRCSNASFKIRFELKNRKPRIQDMTIRARALDTTGFSFGAIDPDYDSLWVYFDFRNASFRLPPVSGNRLADSAWHQLTSSFQLKPLCEHINDTFFVPVRAVDLGCPAIEDSAALIRIIVTPPPKPKPPEVLCLNFIENDGVRILWENTPEDRYFDHLKLHRESPDGTIEVVYSVASRANGKYEDLTTVDPKVSRYKYYLVPYNQCNLPGDTSYHISTTKEFNFPIPSTYFKTATVEDNRAIRVVWLKSNEEDFGYYEVIRWVNGSNNPELVYTSTSQIDTTWLDQAVNVKEVSYCYAVIVYDDCGHVSRPSNKACTIVLRGSAPPFAFDLNWTAYSGWPYGVDDYQLYRSVDTGKLRPIVLLDTANRTFFDEDLDYCWGGYWYAVKAHEEGNLYAESLSNSIYLIQPPLLHIPNAFTMNQDQLNDDWGLVPVFVKEYELDIYNRWGEKVFSTTNKKLDWSGLYKGTRERSEVFVYTVRFTGWDRSTHFRKGTVTIIK